MSFEPWVAYVPRAYVAKCSTMLEGDKGPHNDARTRQFDVVPLEFRINGLAPQGVMSPGIRVDPVVQVDKEQGPPISIFLKLEFLLDGEAPVYCVRESLRLYAGTYLVRLLPWVSTQGAFLARATAYLETLTVIDTWRFRVASTNIEEPTTLANPECVTLSSSALASGTVVLSYFLPSASIVELDVLNASGQLVRRLVREHEQAGCHRREWDCASSSGRGVGHGVFMVRMRAGDKIANTRIMIL
ncbi:MAG: FlgD immunoglobulin-like domain containing protein [candidate division WOR-3 bacterium]